MTPPAGKCQGQVPNPVSSLRTPGRWMIPRDAGSLARWGQGRTPSTVRVGPLTQGLWEFLALWPLNGEQSCFLALAAQQDLWRWVGRVCVGGAWLILTLRKECAGGRTSGGLHEGSPPACGKPPFGCYGQNQAYSLWKYGLHTQRRTSA